MRENEQSQRTMLQDVRLHACLRASLLSRFPRQELDPIDQGDHRPAVGCRAGGYRGDDPLRIFIPQMAVAVQFRLDGCIGSRRTEKCPDLSAAGLPRP